MSWIIIVDMRESNGEILTIRSSKEGSEHSVAQYGTEAEAEEMMRKHPLNVFPYETIDMGER